MINIKDSKNLSPYQLLDDGTFIIKNYQKQAAFSNFLPGIAGLWGIPMWLYYVNRGQCIACFGTEDKDHAFMEFDGANRHYQRVGLEGFRTFIKVKQNDRWSYGEAFHSSSQQEGITETENELHIKPEAIILKETNPHLGLDYTITYYTLPNEPFAALHRVVTIKNSSPLPSDLSVVDGLPMVVPYSLSLKNLKYHTFTSTSYVDIRFYNEHIPFYTLSSIPSDISETEFVTGGNFYIAFIKGNTGSKILPTIVDPKCLFGEAQDLRIPSSFFQAGNFEQPSNQDLICQTPSAFSIADFTLSPQEEIEIHSLLGYAKSVEVLADIQVKATEEGFFQKKLSASKRELKKITDAAFIHSGDNRLNHYFKQSFLDNVLRGGFPITFQTRGKRSTYHLYSRKHGDLERDYNFFKLSPTYFSQGNGNYRDVNQNRRMDIWIEPESAIQNLTQFLNMIQLDGFNPLLCLGATFTCTDTGAIQSLIQETVKENYWDEFSKTLVHKLAKGSSLGSLLNLIYYDYPLIVPQETWLNRLLSISTMHNDADFLEGYWVDHWFYNMDLIDQFIAIFPDQLETLLFKSPDFTFYDSPRYIKDRHQRYVLFDHQEVRQIDVIGFDKDKEALIKSRTRHQHCVHDNFGKGSPYYCNLLTKLSALALIKLASFSPSGIGIDMEGGRPGWYDAMNGLPSLFGASTPEVFQLKRLLKWLYTTLSFFKDSNYTLSLPLECFNLYKQLDHILKSFLENQTEERNFYYWRLSQSAKEHFRHRSFFGIDGAIERIDLRDYLGFLQRGLERIEDSLLRSKRQDGLYITYVSHEAKVYEVLRDDTNKPTMHPRGFPLVKVTHFEGKPLALFLEAQVHGLKNQREQSEGLQLWQEVRNSELYDRDLQMYKLNGDLSGESKEIGRAKSFPPGWLENASIFLHMEYKYLLAQLQAGLYDAFFEDFKKCVVAFQPPERYGRNPLEHVSFIVSSVHERKAYHGRGFQARLSGSTAEILTIMLFMSFGKAPFKWSGNKLSLQFEPILPHELFTTEDKSVEIETLQTEKKSFNLPSNSFSMLFLGKCMVTYLNPKQKSTFGSDGVRPETYTLIYADQSKKMIEGNSLSEDSALEVRSGKVGHIIVTLG